MTNKEIDDYVKAHSQPYMKDWPEYLEAWEVDAGQTVPSYGAGGGRAPRAAGGDDDSFSFPPMVAKLGSRKQTTQGKVTFEGSAKFYPGAYNFGANGWKKDANSPAGAQLWIIKNLPPLPLNPSNEVKRLVEVKWDSEKGKKLPGKKKKTFGLTTFTENKVY
jgi:hypothetical protein